MSSIRPCQIPVNALLGKYQNDGGYADCFVTAVAGVVSHRAFVEAFYTTPLFKVERTLLRLFANRPSTDAQVGQLAAGESDRFAVWQVESRCTDQLLVTAGRTRSWFMVMAEAVDSAEACGTLLYFGSAVIPRQAAGAGQSEMGVGFSALLGFHKLYSRALLASARSRLLALGSGASA